MKDFIEIIFTFIVAIGILVFFFKNEEGIINNKYLDTCPSVVTLEEGDFRTYYKSFVCEYWKSGNDKILGGTCVSYATNFLGDTCKKAYVYDVEPEK